MKNCYIKKLSTTKIAIADLCNYYNKGLIITRINVPKDFRNKGFGSALLKEILEDADKTNTTLFLEISPSDGLNYDELEAWYLRYNFKPWYGIYRRKPKIK